MAPPISGSKRRPTPLSPSAETRAQPKLLGVRNFSSTTESYWSDGSVDGRAADDDSTVFEVELFAPSRLSLELPELSFIHGCSRWVNIRTESGYDFKVQMKKMPSSYVLQREWNLIVDSECLEDEQIQRFELVSYNSFLTWNDDHRRRSPPVGFPTARTTPGAKWTADDFTASRGTVLTPQVVSAMNQIWSLTSPPSKMYVCTILSSHLGSQTMFFSKEYSNTLPPTKRTVALRLVGSSVIIPGALCRYRNQAARISSGWRQFVKEHNICAGEIFVFRFYRGPSAWEFIGCRSGVISV